MQYELERLHSYVSNSGWLISQFYLGEFEHFRLGVTLGTVHLMEGLFLSLTLTFWLALNGSLWSMQGRKRFLWLCYPSSFSCFYFNHIWQDMMMLCLTKTLHSHEYHENWYQGKNNLKTDHNYCNYICCFLSRSGKRREWKRIIEPFTLNTGLYQH